MKFIILLSILLLNGCALLPFTLPFTDPLPLQILSTGHTTYKVYDAITNDEQKEE